MIRTFFNSFRKALCNRMVYICSTFSIVLIAQGNVHILTNGHTFNIIQASNMLFGVSIYMVFAGVLCALPSLKYSHEIRGGNILTAYLSGVLVQILSMGIISALLAVICKKADGEYALSISEIEWRHLAEIGGGYLFLLVRNILAALFAGWWGMCGLIIGTLVKEEFKSALVTAFLYQFIWFMTVDTKLNICYISVALYGTSLAPSDMFLLNISATIIFCVTLIFLGRRDSDALF